MVPSTARRHARRQDPIRPGPLAAASLRRSPVMRKEALLALVSSAGALCWLFTIPGRTGAGS